MSSVKIPTHQRLSFKQAQYMLLFALALGLVFSMIQIMFDYFDTRRDAERTAMEILNISKTSAIQAVYNLDSVLAQELVNGVSQYRMFHQVALINEFDEVMAIQQRPLVQTRWSWLAEYLFQMVDSYAITLEQKGHVYGELKASMDIYMLAEGFVKRTYLMIAATLIQALLLTVVFYLLLRRLITCPLIKLSDRLAQIDAHNPEKLRLEVSHNHKHDELGRLACKANKLLESIEEKVAWQARANEELEKRVAERTVELAHAHQEVSALNERLKAENLRMSAELQITRRLQQMVLPKPEEISQIKELDIACFMEPAAEVGGDYYDILQDNGVVKIGIGDVTGHGLESGVVMLMVQMAVRTLLANHEDDPRGFLNALNRALYGNVQRMQTDRNLTLALLDYQSGLLRLSGQHEEVLLVRRGGHIERIDTQELGFLVGITEDISAWTTHQEFALATGDGIVLYTDGVTEAFNERDECYGLERLCEVVSQNWSGSAKVVLDAVVADVNQHLGNEKVFDDITLLVIKKREDNSP